MRQDPFQKLYEICDSGSMAEKLKSPKSYPLLVDVELTNLCPFTCAMCPTGRGVLMRPKGVMNFKLLEKIVKECAANNCHIRFVRWGEPLAYPQFTDALRLVKVAGLMCHINTNGYYLDYELSCALLRLKLDSIKFSFQGTTQEEYEKWRGKKGIEVLANLQKLHALRGNKEYPYISVGTTVTNETEEQIKKFRMIFGRWCDKVTVGRTRNIIAREEKGCNPECPEVFNKLSIDWDGIVVACCSDFDRFMMVGDVNKDTLYDIFNGERINYFRKMLAEGRHNELEICRGCCANEPMGGVSGANTANTQKTIAADKEVLSGN